MERKIEEADIFVRDAKVIYHVTIHNNKALTLPAGLLTELDWIYGDILQLEKSEDRSKIIISNLTKAQEN